MRTAVRAVMNSTAITLHLLTDQRNRASSWLSAHHEAGGTPNRARTHSRAEADATACQTNSAHMRAAMARVSVPCRICPHHLLALMSQSRMRAPSFMVLQDLLPAQPRTTQAVLRA